MVYLAEIRDEMQQPILRAGAAARHLQIPLPDRGRGKASSPADNRIYFFHITTVQRNYPIGSVDLNRNHSSDVLV